jgi:small subunit ribosomal protein S7
MPRKKKKEFKKEWSPDYKFRSPLATHFVNCLMSRGKKSLAERVFYRAVDLAGEKGGAIGFDVFQKAINNVKPVLEVKSRRVGGANYQVPIEVRPARRIALAIRWLIGFARERNEHSMAEKLAGEFVAASKNEGATVKKKEDTHKMAEANKAFAHFRW